MPNIKARIINKHDTEANWASAVNFTPLAGEVIIYDADESHAYPRFKVGDGKTRVSALPFSTGVSENITVDAELSATSTNPVQNKVITNKLNGLFSFADGVLTINL